MCVDKLVIGSDVHKMLTLLLENYKGVYNKMHQETREKQRFAKMIEELNERLSQAEPGI
jgi:hypothetical protein